MKVKEIHAPIYGKTFNLLSKPNYTETFFGDNKEINSLNFRSDEFKNQHDGLHIIFSGCSVTRGVGLLKEELWTKKVYDKICEEIKCSGYFNLGISATGVCDQVINMFKYFNLYGNPDVIFFMMPDNGRFYNYNKQLNTIHNVFVEDEEKDTILFIYQQYYMMLETYCKSNNIKLFSFTYMPRIQQYFNEYFKTFYKIDYK
jgi:hypothetical protein